MRVKKLMVTFFLLALVVALGVTGVLVIRKMYERKLEEKDAMIADMELILSCYEDTAYVYRLATDVDSESECLISDLESVAVPISTITDQMVIEPDAVVGKYYLLSFSAGTILTTDMFEEYIIEDDMRYMDVVFDEIPIGLAVGDYIDVRISFPLGQDYIALSGKRVAQINSSTVKLIVDSKDFYYYESMKTDLATYRSTKIYGAQYVKPGIQDKAKTYYPVNLDVLYTMLLDPNVDTGDYSGILKSRAQLEDQLLKSDRVDVSNSVTSGKNEISNRFKQASAEYAKLQEKKEKEAAKKKATDN